jgi:hypothetical protein
VPPRGSSRARKTDPAQQVLESGIGAQDIVSAVRLQVGHERIMFAVCLSEPLQGPIGCEPTTSAS